YAFNNPIYYIDYEGLSPRKGQLGNQADVKTEVGNAIKNVSGNYKAQIKAITNHFHKNRMFKYDSENATFNEISGSNHNVVRYVYSKKVGWLDMHHVFRF